ncbi:hypothetical protein HanIR_Chr12g0561611 [Helianthus annuus]|nr:hypothetical protein HanIR_Chr12g0561611 [Helianthus annuus]
MLNGLTLVISRSKTKLHQTSPNRTWKPNHTEHFKMFVIGIIANLSHFFSGPNILNKKSTHNETEPICKIENQYQYELVPETENLKFWFWF